MVNTNLASFCILPTCTVGEAASCMDRSRLGIVLVVDEERRLIGTITDGDLRRAMLARIGLERSLDTIFERKIGSAYAKPIAVPAGKPRSEYLHVLHQHNILHVPVLDEGGGVVGLVSRDEFLPTPLLPLQAVIMAGGQGARLFPLTEHVPKPMLPVGEQPLLEIIIKQLRDSGITRVNVTTHHCGEKIEQHFGDGRELGVDLNYIVEDRPLGTAGGLGSMEAPRETTLVINGDILTRVNFQAMYAFHRAQGADLTVAVRQYDVQVPFGVIECEGAVVRRLREKPVLSFFVNAGIYLLEPVVYQHLVTGQRMDMTDLIQLLLDRSCPVASFPIREGWLDIGQPAEYEQAQNLIKTWQVGA